MDLKKSNRVTWASEPNLRQVKHFREEDCPSEVGRGSQHHPQSQRTHPSILRSSSEGRHCPKQSKEKLPNIPLAKWNCPPKFELDETWRVVAGEESKEAEDQEHRELRVLEAIYPSPSAIPPNPFTSSDLDYICDDSRTQMIPIIPIEEIEDVEVAFHLTPFQNISSKSPDACLPNSPPSSASIVTSQKLPANGNSVPQSLSTFQNPREPPSNSQYSVRRPSNVQSAPPYLSRCQNLKGSGQTQVSPKPLVSYNSVPQYPLTCKNLSTSDHTEYSPNLQASQNYAPKYRTKCENEIISHLKSQVSRTSSANHNPVTQFPCTFKNPNIPQHQAEVLPKSLANQNIAIQCHSTYENLTSAQCINQNSQKLPADGIFMPQYQSSGEDVGFPKQKTQVCSYPPANEKSIPEKPHAFEGDLMISVAAAAAVVAALAKSQEQASLIDTNFLVQLLSNPEQIQKLMMNESGVAMNSETGVVSGSKPIVPSSTTPRPTTDSLDKQIAGNENPKCVVADSTVFSRSLEVRYTNEQRRTVAMSRPVDQVSNKPFNEYQAPHAGSGPIFGPKPLAKSVPSTMTKPETSVLSNLANELAPPHVETANIRGSKPLVHPISDLNLEKYKKLVNEYGAPNDVGGEPLVNSELVPELQTMSPIADHTSPLSPMSPDPFHKDINYYRSMSRQHEDNRESRADEIMHNTNPRGSARGSGSCNYLRPHQLFQSRLPNCAFFNTPRGCRRGSTCRFPHVMSGERRSGGRLEARGSKRMKLSGDYRYRP